MLNKMKSTILYSKVESAVYNAERKVKDTAKATKKPENIKKAAKVACAAATITSAANAGVAIGTMIGQGVTTKAVTSATVHSFKAVLFKNTYDEINKTNNQENKKENK